ncbi:MAG: adenylate/guanylate cyclase domain-containing protein [Oscillospiraceae bacterium]|nr:adenylate/guanylate cyclase domain-containing protein [Oscillospiraceae bacterium]
MNARRSGFFFLLMLLLCVCGVALLAERPIRDSAAVLCGDGNGDWQAVGVSDTDVGAVAGRGDNGFALRFFNLDGKLLSKWEPELPDGLRGGRAAWVMPVRSGLAYLEIYGPNAEELYLYRVNEKNVERLLAVSCTGNTYAERVERTYLTDFRFEEGLLSFTVYNGENTEYYTCRETAGLESAPNGGRDKRAPDGATVTSLTPGRGGWYYIDTSGMEACFADSSGGSVQKLFRLETTRGGRQMSLTSAALSREEFAVYLLDGSFLMAEDVRGARELSGVLQTSRARAVLTLTLYALAALAAAWFLWLVFCGMRRGYASFVVLRGGLLATAAILCFSLLTEAYFEPMMDSEALRINETVVDGVLRTARADARMGDPTLAPEICRMLEGGEEKDFENATVVLSRRSGGRWYDLNGLRSETRPGFVPVLAQESVEQGTVCERRGSVFYLSRTVGERNLSVRVDNAFEPETTRVERLVFLAFLMLFCMTLMILASVRHDIMRLTKKMQQISQGGEFKRFELHTGDELESMASTVNSLGETLREQAEAGETLEHSYRRFVPEKVLALLGKQSIRQVDKSTFAVRRMAMMTVWFSFPDEVYSSTENSRLLFDSVNEVIERTASIVARKGGTVFHFSYSGFDVVMEEGGSEAVSTAVAIRQEVLSLNELRAQKHLPRVTLRIALDVGDVMLGIVGDSTQMEPTTISSGLSVVRELMTLCNRLDAGILCTESMISDAPDYGNRYMGKCTVGDQQVRVYEVFDGDEFNIRRGKAACMHDFTQGVYDLYAGDAALAKHTFLRLAHDYPFDGGARYYLFLADRMSHDPTLPCVLNIDAPNGKGL